MVFTTVTLIKIIPIQADLVAGESIVNWFVTLGLKMAVDRFYFK